MTQLLGWPHENTNEEMGFGTECLSGREIHCYSEPAWQEDVPWAAGIAVEAA